MDGKIAVAAPLERKEEAAPSGMAALRLQNDENRKHQASIASRRDRWIRANRYYYNNVLRLLTHIVEPGRRVLNARAQTGLFLHALRPSVGVGFDISDEMVEIARQKHPDLHFCTAFPEDFESSDRFDYILFNDIDDTVDVQSALTSLRKCCEPHTRVVIYTYNHLWQPLVQWASKLGMRMPQTQQNWLSERDIRGLLELSGYEWLKTYRILLLPKYLPLISAFLNRVVAKLPGINRLCMVNVLIARPQPAPIDPATVSVSVVIPCKDEQGNVEAAVQRIPTLGAETEIIFCDDLSTDGTAEEVRRMQRLHPNRNIRLVTGPGICKSRNVWTGFRVATGDVLIILDADLTVMPEELPYFVNAIVTGRAEFVNGSRLVYPVPKMAMKSANMLGNKAFSVIFSYLLGQPLKDTLCGTKVLWRRDWQRLEPMLNTWGVEDRWGDYELLFGAAKLNLKLLDQPVHYQERIYGVTKMTKVFKNGLIMLKMCLYGFLKLKVEY